MERVSMIGIDLAKNSFQAHGARADGSVAFRRKLSRAKILDFMASQPRCTVVMEACASAHYWGREIGGLGACAVGKLTTICSSIRSFVTTTYGV